MSATYGIAGLVDGFVNGRNVRNGWQDRKDAKERQKKMDELVFAQDARSATEHEKRMRVYDQNSTTWQQGYDDDQGMRQAGQAAVDAANAGMGATDEKATAAGPDAAQPIPGDPVAGVAANLGIPMGAVPNLAAEGMPSPEQLMEKYGGQTTAPGGKVAVRADATAGAGARAGVSPPMGAVASPHTYDEWRAMDAQQRHDAGLPTSEIGGQLHFSRFGVGMGTNDQQTGAPLEQSNFSKAIAPDPNHDFGNSLLPDAAEAGKRVVSGIGGLVSGAGKAAVNVADKAATDVPNAVNSAINPYLRYATGGAAEIPMLTGNGLETAYQSEIDAKDAAASSTANLKSLSDTWQQATTPALGATPPPAAAPAPGPRKSNAPASAPPATKAMAETATAAMSEASTPAVQAAAEASATNGPALGVKPGDKVTEPQRKRAAASFIDQYMKVGAPIVIEEMLKQGKFAEAQKFQEFLDQSETKAGMENWARAAFAANVGDMDTFSDEILQAYNRLGYFPDGTTIVKEQSGFTYDKSGAISGAKITFKDEATGNTFDQVFSDPNDLVRLGITLLAPESAFEHYAAEQAAKNAAAAKAAEDAKPKRVDPVEAQKDLDKRIDEAAKLIFEKTVDQMGNPTLTYEEARAQAARILAAKPPGQTQGPPMPPPVAYRPAN